VRSGSGHWGSRAKRTAISSRQVAKEARPIGSFVQGFNAARRGLTPVDCPYVLDTADWIAWYKGWSIALEGRQLYGTQV
jgi:hypothetical protein